MLAWHWMLWCHDVSLTLDACAATHSGTAQILLNMLSVKFDSCKSVECGWEWGKWSGGEWSRGEQFRVNGPEVSGPGVNSLEWVVQGWTVQSEWSRGEWSRGEQFGVNGPGVSGPGWTVWGWIVWTEWSRVNGLGVNSSEWLVQGTWSGGDVWNK